MDDVGAFGRAAGTGVNSPFPPGGLQRPIPPQGTPHYRTKLWREYATKVENWNKAIDRGGGPADEKIKLTKGLKNHLENKNRNNAT